MSAVVSEDYRGRYWTRRQRGVLALMTPGPGMDHLVLTHVSGGWAWSHETWDAPFAGPTGCFPAWQDAADAAVRHAERCPCT